MKILLVVSSILGMATATRVYCDLEQTSTSNTVVPPVGLRISFWFNCNNDMTYTSQKGVVGYLMNSLLPCNGCNKWYGSEGGGYAINPKQNQDKPGAITFWLKYDGKECNTNHDDNGDKFSIECNV